MEREAIDCHPYHEDIALDENINALIDVHPRGSLQRHLTCYSMLLGSLDHGGDSHSFYRYLSSFSEQPENFAGFNDSNNVNADNFDIDSNQDPGDAIATVSLRSPLSSFDFPLPSSHDGGDGRVDDEIKKTAKRIGLATPARKKNQKSSTGGPCCNCKKGCHDKKCGCRRAGKFCKHDCKCEGCKNKAPGGDIGSGGDRSESSLLPFDDDVTKQYNDMIGFPMMMDAFNYIPDYITGPPPAAT